MRIINKILGYISFLCFMGCMSCSGNIDNELEHIYSIADTDSRMAKHLIDSLYQHRKSFSDDEYNKFIVYSTLVKDKNFEDIANDTLIFSTHDYFIRNHDNHFTALSYLYSARVLEANKNGLEASKNYLEAEKYLELTDEIRLKGVLQYFIGNNYSKQGLYEKALERYKIAGEYFSEAKDTASIMKIDLNIGNSYTQKSKQDSALVYYQKCADLANVIGDVAILYKVEKNIGLLWRSLNSRSKAISHLSSSLKYSTNSVDSATVYILLSNQYIDYNADSTKYYIDKALSIVNAEDIKERIFYAEALKVQSSFTESNLRYKEALELYKEYSNLRFKILSERKSKELLEVEKKYNTERLEKEKTETIIAKQRIQLISLILIIGALVVIVIMYKMIKNKRANIIEMESKIDYFRETASKYKNETSQLAQTNDVANQIMTKYFNILKKSISLEGYFKEDSRATRQVLLKKFNEIVYGQNSFDWNSFLMTINQLNDNALDKIKQKFPKLDDSEYKICCLAYCELTNVEISIILGLSVNTIKTKKYLLRKKMNITDYSNFIEGVNDAIK